MLANIFVELPGDYDEFQLEQDQIWARRGVDTLRELYKNSEDSRVHWLYSIIQQLCERATAAAQMMTEKRQQQRQQERDSQQQQAEAMAASTTFGGILFEDEVDLFPVPSPGMSFGGTPAAAGGLWGAFNWS